MLKIDPTVKKETKYIAWCVFALSILMQAVFLLINKWNDTVLLGNILSGLASVLNFLFLGLTVQKAVTKEKDDAKKVMQISRIYRMLFMVLVLIIGITLSCFHNWSVIIPVFFPRIAIFLRPLFDKQKKQ